MIIPSQIKIGGFQWTIEQQMDVAREGDIYGSTHHTSQKIFLDPTMPRQKLEQTLLHEIMHAIWWQSGIERGSEDKKLEERVIHALSMGLYQVLQDNNLLQENTLL
jgi:hypothetical protein